MAASMAKQEPSGDLKVVLSSPERVKSMHPSVRAELTSFYKEYNERLAELLEDDAFLWTDVTG